MIKGFKNDIQDVLNKPVCFDNFQSLLLEIFKCIFYSFIVGSLSNMSLIFFKYIAWLKLAFLKKSVVLKNVAVSFNTIKLTFKICYKNTIILFDIEIPKM